MVIWIQVEGDLLDMLVCWVIFYFFDVDQVMIVIELGVWIMDDFDGVSIEWFLINFFGLVNVWVDMLQYCIFDNLIVVVIYG